MHHVQLHNVIGHIFGVIQKCFIMMRCESMLPIEYQSKATLAMLDMHTFICIHNPTDLVGAGESDESPDVDTTIHQAHINSHQTQIEITKANAF